MTEIGRHLHPSVFPSPNRQILRMSKIKIIFRAGQCCFTLKQRARIMVSREYPTFRLRGGDETASPPLPIELSKFQMRVRFEIYFF